MYTLRRRRKILGNDIAVQGNYKNHSKIGEVFIQEIEKINKSKQLENYLSQSGMTSIDEWFNKATELSGHNLYLYKVTINE